MGAVLTPEPDRRRQGRPSAQRLDLLRPLRGGLPDAHSAAEDDAALARARVRAASVAGDGALRPARSGPSSPSGRGSTALATGVGAARCSRCVGRRRGPLPLAAARRRLDRAIATCRRREGATFQAQWRGRAGRAMSARDDASSASIRRSLGVDRRRGAAPRGGRASAWPASARASFRRAGSCAPRERGSTLFAPMAEAGRRHASTQLARVDDVPAAVAAYPARAQPADAGAARRRSAARRPAVATRARARGHHRAAATASDLVAVTHAFAGVAETGTLVLVSGPDNPTTLNFLPETHIVVLDAKDIVGDYETPVAAPARAATARASCRAPSTGSPARRAPPTSSRR